MKALTSRLLTESGVTHGFGTRAEPFPSALAKSWEETKPQWKQVHGTASIEVLQPGQACGDVDALWTQSPRQPIAVVTADCVPVLLARKDGTAVAAVHAGWRGTWAKIVPALLHSLTRRGERLSDWVAAIGPAIGPCCYEVSVEIAHDFSKAYARAVMGRMLDLPLINRLQLEQAGIAEVDLLRACTRCTRDAGGEFAFHSYRREGGGTRQTSAIEITGLAVR